MRQIHLNRATAGGHLLIQGSLGEHVYTVGSAAFPTLDVDLDQVVSAFDDCHLSVVDMELCRKQSTHYFAVLKKPAWQCNEQWVSIAYQQLQLKTFLAKILQCWRSEWLFKVLSEINAKQIAKKLLT